MKFKFIPCLGLFLITVSTGSLAKAKSATSQQPAPVKVWDYINYYPFPPSAPDEPNFVLQSGQVDCQVSRGLRLDVRYLPYTFFKTNAVRARLFRANGEVVEPTEEGKKMLRIPLGCGRSLTGGPPPQQVITYFPWGANVLEESWIEFLMGPEHYWLEIPYGFDRNPMDPPAPSIPAGDPQFNPAMKVLTEHDHVVHWQHVQYSLGRRGGVRVDLKQSNPFDAQSDVDLDKPAFWTLDSPAISVRILNADGTKLDGRCVNRHLNDNWYQRIDTFNFGTYGDDWRCWGQLEIGVGDKTYRVIVPSSLYKYTQGHAYKPEAAGLASSLRIGMRLGEVNYLLGNYNCVRAFTARHLYQCSFNSEARDVVMQFDESDRLVSWKSGQQSH